jgi:hypothetical protein
MEKTTAIKSQPFMNGFQSSKISLSSKSPFSTNDDEDPLISIRQMFEGKIDAIEEMIIESYRVLSEKIDSMDLSVSILNKEVSENINSTRHDFTKRMENLEQTISQSYQDALSRIMKSESQKQPQMQHIQTTNAIKKSKRSIFINYIIKRH